ncbi:unnamed protein product [Cuscuta campestris]|uniref:RING-type E3 ubiquitin transferase n=1 Tax=Cuscuta campestris TaxID=132261 RepID=A0A484NDI5_9ASTE|nr:unnamed protein product [Cuscuta campestris]
MENEYITTYFVRAFGASTAAEPPPHNGVGVYFTLCTSQYDIDADKGLPMKQESINTVCRHLNNEGRYLMLHGVLMKWKHALDCRTMLSITREVVEKARQQISLCIRVMIRVKILSVQILADAGWTKRVRWAQEEAISRAKMALVPHEGVRTAIESALKRKRMGNYRRYCVICLEEMAAETAKRIGKNKIDEIKGCNHEVGYHFHHACISSWLKVKTSCPLCRREIKIVCLRRRGRSSDDKERLQRSGLISGGNDNGRSSSSSLV